MSPAEADAEVNGMKRQLSDEIDKYGLMQLDSNKNIVKDELGISIEFSSIEQELVLNNNTLDDIVQEARTRLRKDVGKKQLPSLVAANASDGGGNLIRDSTDSNYFSLDQTNLVNNRAIHPMLKKNFDSNGCKIRDNAVGYISEAAQIIAKNIMDTAIIHNKRRRNKFASNSYKNIQILLQSKSSNGGTRGLNSCRSNIGIKFSGDIRKLCLQEAKRKESTMSANMEELEQKLAAHMQEYDDARSSFTSNNKSKTKAKAKGGGSSSSSSSSSSGGDNFSRKRRRRRRKRKRRGGKYRHRRHTLGQRQPWWTRDDEMVKEGKYNIDQVRISKFKLDIAKRYGVDHTKDKNRIKVVVVIVVTVVVRRRRRRRRRRRKRQILWTLTLTMMTVTVTVTATATQIYLVVRRKMALRRMF